MSNILIEFAASILIWIMFAGLFLLWVIDGKIKKETALHALLAVFLSWTFANIFKEIVPTPRPFHINDLPTYVIIPPNNSAFPSSHTAFAFSMAVTIWLHNKKWGLVYLILALCVGLARILANVHFPLDILGGALLGTITSLLIEKFHLFKVVKA